jgi:hypothetical protein
VGVDLKTLLSGGGATAAVASGGVLAIVGGALLGAYSLLSGIKGKTGHLTWDESLSVARPFADKVQSMFNTMPQATQIKVARNLGEKMIALMAERYREGNSSWGINVNLWSNEISKMLNTDSPKLNIWDAVYMIVMFGANNYDAARPDDLQLYIQSILDKFFSEIPEAVSVFTPIAANAQKKDQKNALEQTVNSIFGSPGGGGGTPSTPQTTKAGMDPNAQGIAGIAFILLIGGGLYLASKKGR